MGKTSKCFDQQGYLMVEYLVSISLMMVVILALFTLLNSSCMAFAVYALTSDLHYSARNSMAQIRSDVLGSKDLSVNDGGQRLKLQTYSGMVQYYIENNQLYRYKSVKLPVAENAESISFREVRPGLVEIRFQAGAAGKRYVLHSAFQIRGSK